MAENTISISELDEAESLNNTDKIIVETADGESLAVKLADIHEAIGTSIDQISVAATQGAVGATPAASINELTGSTDQHKKYGINFTIPKLNDIASVSKTESDQNAGTNTLTITLQDGNSYTLNVKNGAKGDTGSPFTVAHVYSSIAAMNAAYATDGIAQGAFVVIDTGSVEDADTGKLYIKGESAYEYLTDLSGATGMTGPTGATGAAAGFGTPTATVDSNVGTPAVTVTASGPDTAKVFNFAFSNLKGQTGDTGTGFGSQSKQSGSGTQNNPLVTRTINNSVVVDSSYINLQAGYRKQYPGTDENKDVSVTLHSESDKSQIDLNVPGHNLELSDTAGLTLDNSKVLTAADVVDSVTSNNMNSVTSNAVAVAFNAMNYSNNVIKVGNFYIETVNIFLGTVTFTNGRASVNLNYNFTAPFSETPFVILNSQNDIDYGYCSVIGIIRNKTKISTLALWRNTDGTYNDIYIKGIAMGK